MKVDEKRIEDGLNKIKEQIPVNYELKKRLRKSFKKNGWRNKLLAMVAAAALLLMILYSFGNKNFTDNFIQKVNAADLKILNQMSFINMGKINAGKIAEYNGTIYIPLYDKGIFEYNSKGFKKISDRPADYVSISADGTKLVFSSNGSIYLRDLKMGKESQVLKGDGTFTFYENPSLSPDGNKIIYTKKVYAPRKTHGFEVKESSIYAVDLKTLKAVKYADGSYGSFIKGRDAIVFEKDNKIIYKDLKENKEKVVDSGRFPAVSPDGYYIAYEKTQSNAEEIDGVKVVEDVSNIWVTDVESFATKKQVTMNVENKYINKENMVKDKKVQSIAIEALYSYYDPVWSSSSNSIFVLKNTNADFKGNIMQLMKIDLSKEKLRAEDVVRRYLQALIVRDDDFAKILMKNPPSMLTISNPHPVAYAILKSGSEGEKMYVDAELSYAYTMDSYYSVQKSRYYLEPANNGYIINSAKSLSTVEYVGKDGVMYKIEDKKDIKLFDKNSVPKEYIPNGNYRFGPIAFSRTGVLIFTMQGVNKPEVKLLAYNLNDKEFKMIDSVDNGFFYELKVDERGKYLAANFFDERTKKNGVYLYDLSTGKKTQISSMFKGVEISNIAAVFWNGDKLIIDITSNEGQTVSYEYNPLTGKINIP